MTNDLHLDLRVVEQRTCKIASEQLGIPLNKVLPTSRLIEDLHCDSLELVELIMELEDEFQVTIPNEHPIQLASQSLPAVLFDCVTLPKSFTYNKVLESRNAKNGRRNHLQLRKFLQMNVRRSHLVNLAVVGN